MLYSCDVTNNVDQYDVLGNGETIRIPVNKNMAKVWIVDVALEQENEVIFLTKKRK